MSDATNASKPRTSKVTITLNDLTGRAVSAQTRLVVNGRLRRHQTFIDAGAMTQVPNMSGNTDSGATTYEVGSLIIAELGHLDNTFGIVETKRVLLEVVDDQLCEVIIAMGNSTLRITGVQLAPAGALANVKL